MTESEHDKDAVIAALQAEIDTMKTIISMMPGHVYWKNASGQYMGCNSNVAKVLNLHSPEEVLGKTDEDLLGPDFADSIRKIDLEVINSKKEMRIEETGADSNGAPALYLTQKTPLYDRTGKIKGIFGISLDITARKQMEEKLKIAKKKAEAANRAKSKFLAMISHELRTPLTSILGFVSFLEQDKTNPTEKKLYIKHIIDSGSYLLSLINNLLDFNKLETNNYKIASEPFNLKELMKDVLNMLSGSAKIKKLNLALHFDTMLPEIVISDSHVLRQILVNLVGNAVKFTEKGFVNINAHCKQVYSDAIELQIAVEDSGIGIPPDQMQTIFKRFYQIGNVYTRNKSLTGTGLGLSIVKRLVKLIGSKIEIKSVLNQGSTFYFTVRLGIPAKIKAPTNIDETTSVNNPIYLDNSDKINHVLLVEDDTLIQIVHKQMLEELGYKVDIAECASKAINMLHNYYDIIFVDIGLPDMNGFDLIKAIRESHPNRKRIPIIALTGYSEEPELQQCLQAGADKAVVKPITKTALGNLLEQYLSSLTTI